MQSTHGADLKSHLHDSATQPPRERERGGGRAGRTGASQGRRRQRKIDMSSEEEGKRKNIWSGLDKLGR